MGYKPKFSGRWGEKVTEENMNDGNFVHDPGYWKLLIDRRMYDRNGKYQWLDPVTSENFEPDLVNPLKTGEEFNITQVADDKDAEDIAERVYNNMAERDGGVAKVDYSKPLDKIMDEYDAALSAGVQANVKLTDAEEDALGDMEEAMEEEAEDGGVLFSTSEEIEELNNLFNEQLQQQIEGTLPQGHVYEMGTPSVYLLSTKIPYLPIRLQASVLNRKTNDPAHPYDLSEVHDLVKLIQKPIAIFKYGDEEKAQNLMVGISQDVDDGRQFLVGLALNPSVNGKELEINSVRNVFPKNYHDWVHWINQGKMLRVDGKEEIQAIIDALRINPVDYISDDDLDNATKIVKDFPNPELPTEKNAEKAEKSSETTENGENMLFSTSPTFYSNAERAVENIKQNKATAEQWKAMLTKVGGLKAGEDKWMGLSAWLDENKGKSLTKDEVLQFVRDNGIQMEEVNYGEANTPEEELRREVLGDIYEYGRTVESTLEHYKEKEKDEERFIARLEKEGRTELAESTKESLEKLREKIRILESAAPNDPESIRPPYEANGTRLEYTTDGLRIYREIAFKVPNIEPYQVDDEVHFGPENQGKAVMWVRFGETTDADGNRVLVIDEIQSNRHQDAREIGYSSSEETKAKAEEAKKEMEDFIKQMQKKYKTQYWGTKCTHEENVRYHQLSNRYESILNSGVPSAPFEKNWHEVAIKRMLRLAAEEGFDKVAWTTGEQQAKRYNLGRMYDSIEREDNPSIDGKRFVLSGRNMDTFVVNKEGNIEDSSFSEFNGKPLSDVVGKDLAERMMNLEDGDMLEGEDLRIGGEGMKGFYDQMLPRFMDKYGKRWGVKTGTVELPNVEEAGRTMHSVDVTPEMKESVMQGQPLFSTSAKDEITSVDEANRIVTDLPRRWNIKEGFATFYAIDSEETSERITGLIMPYLTCLERLVKVGKLSIFFWNH